MKGSQDAETLRTRERTVDQKRRSALLVSRHRQATYNGLAECAAAGLHDCAFRLF